MLPASDSVNVNADVCVDVDSDIDIAIAIAIFFLFGNALASNLGQKSQAAHMCNHVQPAPMPQSTEFSIETPFWFCHWRWS